MSRASHPTGRRSRPCGSGSRLGPQSPHSPPRYIDGVKWFEDTNLSHLPPGPMHQTIQLDWFPSGSTATTPSRMNVDWIRIYGV